MTAGSYITLHTDILGKLLPLSLDISLLSNDFGKMVDSL